MLFIWLTAIGGDMDGGGGTEYCRWVSPGCLWGVVYMVGDAGGEEALREQDWVQDRGVVGWSKKRSATVV